MQKLRIIQDDSAESPREWDNLGTIAYAHSRYTLGEEKIDDPIEWLEDMLGLDRLYIESPQRLASLEKRFFDKYIVLPVYMYDHSAISLSTTPFSCSWDSGKLGYIYAHKEDIRKEYGVKRITKKVRELVESILKSEINTFDHYVQGEVYGYIVEDEAGDQVDSCWGFIGDFRAAESGMKDHLPEELWEQLENAEVEC